MSEQLVLKGTLKGHNGWVTQIATNPLNPDTILSSSRGKFLSNFTPLGFIYMLMYFFVIPIITGCFCASMFSRIVILGRVYH